MSEAVNPPIPGLGEPEEWKLKDPEGAPPPGAVTPAAGTWVDKFSYMAPAGQQGRLVAGQFSTLWTGTLPTGLNRFQVLEQVAPPALAELVRFTGPLSANPGQEITLTVELSANVLVATPVAIQCGSFGNAVAAVPSGQALGTVRVTIPIGQPTVPTLFNASLRTKLLSWWVEVVPRLVPVAELTQFTGPPSAKPGETFPVLATLSAPAPPFGASVSLFEPFGAGPLLIPAGQTTGMGNESVPVDHTGGLTTLKASYQGRTLTSPLTVVKDTPPPPVPGPVPVIRVIDRTGATQQQIQAAIDAVQPGDGIYLGPGVYQFPGPSRSADGQMLDVLNRDGITIYGAGPSTILDMGGREGIWCRQGGRIGDGNCIRDLAIRNCRRAVVALDPQRLWVQRVSMTSCSHGYATERTSAYDNAQFRWPVTITDCGVFGWGAHAMMLHGGETVQRCQLIDIPGNSGSTYSHGLYIQGCLDVLVEDLEIANTSGHAFQIYSDSATHLANGANNVVMRRINCNRCFYGPIWAANGPYTNLVLEDLTVTGTVSRATGTFVISGTNDWITGARLSNIVLDGGGEGLVLQGGQTGGIRGMAVDGLRISNHNVGILIGSAATSWPYTTIESSWIRGYQTANVPAPRQGSSSGLLISS